MLARVQKVDGNGRMHIVGGADRHALQLRVVQYIVIIGERGSASILFAKLLSALGDNIHKVLYLGQISVGLIAGQMGAAGDLTAANDGDLDLLHEDSPFAIL